MNFIVFEGTLWPSSNWIEFEFFFFLVFLMILFLVSIIKMNKNVYILSTPHDLFIKKNILFHVPSSIVVDFLNLVYIKFYSILSIFKQQIHVILTISKSQTLLYYMKTFFFSSVFLMSIMSQHQNFSIP